ncbi:MAG: VWA domain-containing protein [Acidobacteria bacterium]|nr:VWA domain-containing protein [Acidobacteriota bacterium]
MQFLRIARVCLTLAAFLLVPAIFSGLAAAQSKPQKTEKAQGEGKKNQRPDPKTEEERKRAEEEKNAVVDPVVEKVESSIVGVDVVVFNKKTGQIVTDLHKANFQIFENGVKQEITSFAASESPITVSMVLEYSKLTQALGSASGGWYEPGQYEAIKPVAYFLARFIKPPNDYASVVAFDVRPTPITDFTNDPRRLNESVNLLFRNSPAWTETNLFDALKFSLVGGRADSVVLENSKSETALYGGMADVQAKRKAIILVASGLDTFSKTNYDTIRNIIQEAGVPIYVISTGNYFMKKYGDRLGDQDGLLGSVNPGRLSMLQAQNTLNTIAKESGGKHFPMTFEGDIPGILESINAMLRSQYSLAYDLAADHTPGKKYKIEVKVDVDGDGQTDEKTYVVQYRPFYQVPEKKKS